MAAAAAADGKSDYELQRELNIRKNEEKLRELGMEGSIGGRVSPRTPAKKKALKMRQRYAPVKAARAALVKDAEVDSFGNVLQPGTHTTAFLNLADLVPSCMTLRFLCTNIAPVPPPSTVVPVHHSILRLLRDAD